MPNPHLGTLSQLVVDEEVGRVTNGFTEIIGASFVADGGTPTADEIKRRFNLCLRIFCEIRADLKWPIVKILDRLPYYLRCELDGGKYNPADEDRGRAMWAEKDDPLAPANIRAPQADDHPLLVDSQGRPLSR